MTVPVVARRGRMSGGAQQNADHEDRRFVFGGPGRNRTIDTRIFNPPLYFHRATRPLCLTGRFRCRDQRRTPVYINLELLFASTQIDTQLFEFSIAGGAPGRSSPRSQAAAAFASQEFKQARLISSLGSRSGRSSSNFVQKRKDLVGDGRAPTRAMTAP